MTPKRQLRWDKIDPYTFHIQREAENDAERQRAVTYIHANPLDSVNVKGLGEPLEVYELSGASTARTRLQASAARGLTRFVGRDADLEHLRRTQQSGRRPLDEEPLPADSRAHRATRMAPLPPGSALAVRGGTDIAASGSDFSGNAQEGLDLAPGRSRTLVAGHGDMDVTSAGGERLDRKPWQINYQGPCVFSGHAS